MIMGQSAGVIAALSLSNMSKTGATLHDIDIDTMHAALLKDGQKMNEACHIAPPPAPPGPHAAEYTVSGAGTSSCNGVYLLRGICVNLLWINLIYLSKGFIPNS